jgi:hypothetical protein
MADETPGTATPPVDQEKEQLRQAVAGLQKQLATEKQAHIETKRTLSDQIADREKTIAAEVATRKAIADLANVSPDVAAKRLEMQQQIDALNQGLKQLGK